MEAHEDAEFESNFVRYFGSLIDKHFNTSVAGTARENEWGSSRQEILQDCRAGTMLTLIAEPDNERDPNAVMVWVDGSDCAGYLKQSVAPEISHDITNQNRTWLGFVSEVTGGTIERENFGLNILIFRLKEQHAKTARVAATRIIFSEAIIRIRKRAK